MLREMQCFLLEDNVKVKFHNLSMSFIANFLNVIKGGKQHHLKLCV